MTVKQRRDIKQFVIQFGAALAVSFAGFLYSRFRNKRRTKPSLPPLKIPPSDHARSETESRDGGRGAGHIGHLNNSISGDTPMQKTSMDISVVGLSPSSRYSEDEKECFLLPEFNDFVKEINVPVCNDIEIQKSDSSAPLAFPNEEKFDYEKEVRQLKNNIRMLQERERSLEAKLLEYYSLKEQQKVALELRSRLILNQMETKVFSLKIESLQAENKRLNAQVADHAKVIAELEVAKSEIKLLKKKLRTEAQQNKEQILSLQERVAKLQEQELKACRANPDTEMRMQRLIELEAEVNELRKSNTRLQYENSELAERLESTQNLANSKLEDLEKQALNETCYRLRHENEEMKREIEQLQADRCVDLEELVYLKWINACLRYELRNYQPPSGKAVARDLSKTLSPESEERAKQLILEYAQTEGFDDKPEFDYDWWSSSQGSLVTDSWDLENSSVDTSLASKTNKLGKKNHLLGKLRKLLLGTDTHHHNNNHHNERLRSPEHWDAHGSTSSSGNHFTPEYQNNRIGTPQLNFRHSMDFQMLMRNREEFKDVGSGSRLKSSGKSDLIKYAEALKNSNAAKKLHKKSASYCLG